MTPPPKSFSRRGDSYGRNKLSLSGKSFLIVTEGEKTEPNYFRSLLKRLQLVSPNFTIIHPEATDPVSLTQAAIALCEERRKLSKKNNVVAYDEVWIVFDLEGPHNQRQKLAQQARMITGAENFHFASSNPCFEFWLLLHSEYTTAPFIDCDSIIKRLKKHWVDYVKGVAPSLEIHSKLSEAIARAERCRQHHEVSKGDGNPSTCVDLLVRNLNNEARPHHRIDI